MKMQTERFAAVIAVAIADLCCESSQRLTVMLTTHYLASHEATSQVASVASRIVASPCALAYSTQYRRDGRRQARQLLYLSDPYPYV